MSDKESYSEGDLLVFDLRGGRVGGLTFCRIVETWFKPWEIFEIDNDMVVAVEQWNRLPQSHRDGMRFIWGHEFSKFQKNVNLTRCLKIVSLVRHPLLKVSGLSIREDYDLTDFDWRSVRHEFECYVRDGGVLPLDSMESFLSGHFFVGITELMEESLFLLRDRLGVRKPVNAWERIGSHADLCSNIYARGAVRAFVCQPHYNQEISYYLSAKARLLAEVDRTGLTRRADYLKYKAGCQDRDAALSKWSLLYPELFSIAANDPEPAPGIKQSVRRWAERIAPSRRRRLAASPTDSSQTRIVPGQNCWALWPGQDDIEHEICDDTPQEFGAVISSVFSIRIQWPKSGLAMTNLVQVQLELPSADQADRWVHCAVMGQPLFRLDVGAAASLRRFDIPVSRRVAHIQLTIGPDEPATRKVGEAYVRIRKMSAVSIPMGGEPARTVLH